jgi:hypothetical protein
MRHADGAQRRMLQVRELRQHFRLQLIAKPLVFVRRTWRRVRKLDEHWFGTSFNSLAT